jgi:hypothetical protein
MTTSGLMMISCFYACTGFILAGISQKPIPVPEAVMILLFATALTGIHSQRGWRPIYIAGLHLAGWLFASLWLCHRYYKLESIFRHPGWILDFFMLDRAVTGWLFLILLFFCVFSLWFCGIRLSLMPADQATVSHRFDMGLACFLAIGLIKLLINVKSGTLPLAHSSMMPLIVFMVAGLFSMGVVRTRDASRTENATGFRSAGVVLGFTFMILLTGGGLFLFSSPKLQTVAEAGGGWFGTLAGPIEQMVLVLARFFLENGFRLKLGADSPTGSPPAIPAMEGPEISEFIVHLATGITIALLLATLGLLLYVLLKWLSERLFVKTMKAKGRQGIWALLCLYADAIKHLFISILNRMHLIADTSCAADKFYQRLLRWGRLSGLDHDVAETPKEYGIRLGHRFPELQKEIRLIICLHDEAVYGGIVPDSHQISAAKYALKRLRNPLLWFARI